MSNWIVEIGQNLAGQQLPDQTRHEFGDEASAKACARAFTKRGFAIRAARADGSRAIDTRAELVKWLTVSAEELRLSSSRSPHDGNGEA